MNYKKFYLYYKLYILIKKNYYFQINTSPTLFPDTIYLLSHVTQTHYQPSLLFNTFIQSLVLKSHILIVSSILPDIIYWLLFVIHTDNTSFLWSLKEYKQYPSFKYQIRIVLS